MGFDLEEKLEDGRLRYETLSNGATYDHAIGRIVGPPTTGLITSETGKAMALRKGELARERAIAGIDAAAIAEGRIPKNAPRGAGWIAVVEHVTKTLLTSKNLRGQAEAANFLGKASGHTLDEEQADRGGNVLVVLLKLFDKLEQKNVIDGEITDERTK